MKRLVALVPPRGLHLTCFHGVFAPNASLRTEVMLPSPSPKPAPGATPAARPKRVRLDWATALQRTFGIDVWTCHCGGHAAQHGAGLGADSAARLPVTTSALVVAVMVRVLGRG